jgi:hypothetical protein
MAIVQISKIIHRTGANLDLPQLDPGEIGFATDDRRVYIGNDDALHEAEGSNLTTQTEILTEVSPLDFAKITGVANTEIEITTPKIGQLLVLDGSSTTLVGNKWVNWTGDMLGNGAVHSNNKLHLGNVANLEITGGMSGGVLSTDGAGNLYWTTVEGGGGSGLPGQTNNNGKYLKTSGTTATWENVFSDTNFATTVRSNISVTDNGGDGSLSYNSALGVITYTGPSATEARAHFSAGTGVTFDSANGQFSIAQDVSATASPAFDNLTLNSVTVSGLYQVDDPGADVPTVRNAVVYNNSSNTLATNSGFFYSPSHNTLTVGKLVTDGNITIGTTNTDGTHNIGYLGLANITSGDTTKAPSDPGIAGQICWDQNYIYICTYQDTWEKIEIGATVSTGGVTSYNDLTDTPTLFSGSYNDLTDTPILFDGAYSSLTGTPTPFSGSYNDLTDTPTLFSGSYLDLSNKPTIPSKTSDLSNDSGFVTGATGSNTQIQYNINGAFSSSSKLTFDPDYGGGALTAPYIHANGFGGLEVTNSANVYGNINVNGNIQVGEAANVPNLNLKWNGGANTFRIFANIDGVFLEDTSDHTFFRFTLTAVV